MEISYKNRKLERSCDTESSAKACYGSCAKKVVQRLGQLYAAIDLTDIKKDPSAHLHQLKGDRSGQFAINTKQPFRIIFIPEEDFDILDYSTIKKIKILEININYHDD